MTKEPTTNADHVAELAFEPAMARLEAIVARLESEDATLDESMELFSEGVAIVKRCRGVLGEAEKRVQELLDEQGLADMVEEDKPSP